MVRHFCLTIHLAHLIGHLARLMDYLARIMAKWYDDYSPFSVQKTLLPLSPQFPFSLLFLTRSSLCIDPPPAAPTQLPHASNAPIDGCTTWHSTPSLPPMLLIKGGKPSPSPLPLALRDYISSMASLATPPTTTTITIGPTTSSGSPILLRSHVIKDLTKAQKHQPPTLIEFTGYGKGGGYCRRHWQMEMEIIEVGLICLLLFSFLTSNLIFFQFSIQMIPTCRPIDRFAILSVYETT